MTLFVQKNFVIFFLIDAQKNNELYNFFILIKLNISVNKSFSTYKKYSIIK